MPDGHPAQGEGPGLATILGVYEVETAPKLPLSERRKRHIQRSRHSTSHALGLEVRVGFPSLVDFFGLAGMAWDCTYIFQEEEYLHSVGNTLPRQQEDRLDVATPSFPIRCDVPLLYAN